jgi:hypothetical protein
MHTRYAMRNPDVTRSPEAPERPFVTLGDSSFARARSLRWAPPTFARRRSHDRHRRHAQRRQIHARHRAYVHQALAVNYLLATIAPRGARCPLLKARPGKLTDIFHSGRIRLATVSFGDIEARRSAPDCSAFRRAHMPPTVRPIMTLVNVRGPVASSDGTWPTETGRQRHR